MSNRIVENHIDEYYYDDITKDKIIEKRPDLSYIFNTDMEYDSSVLSFICDCNKKPEKINTDKFKTISRNVALKFMIDTGRLHLDDYNVYDGKTPIENDERFKPLELLLREEIGFCVYGSKNRKVRKHLINLSLSHTIDMNDFENDNEFSNFTRKIIEESFAIIPYEHLRVGQIFKYLGPYQIPRFFPDWDRKFNIHILYNEYTYNPSSCYEDYASVPCCFAGYI